MCQTSVSTTLWTCGHRTQQFLATVMCAAAQRNRRPCPQPRIQHTGSTRARTKCPRCRVR
ncbi:hypothetical protein BDZ85DRAFT_56612 [Elsinoe ampelina]|uniref:Uncharacterized protein n=1 Tax=Elsinoe ampelina TaxID=302913 RepID=A0A6A6GNP8_9PEZI|nr:hypothetical protein BDZ85DRAFT_56612 [Elsinoe ampelina]